jgi:PTS hybrid protein
MGTCVELDIANPSGLHARPAATFVRAASGFRSDIRVSNLSTGTGEVPAKSIIAVLGLGVERGHRVRIRIEGADEDAAAAALRELVEAGLGEAIGDAAGPSGS